MAQSLNRVELIGRLGGDPEQRFTGDGTPVANFRLATDRPARAGATPQTDWHTIVCWDRRAEFATQYLTKGRLVFVAGRLTYREYDDKGGQRRVAVEIVASELIPLDSRGGAQPPAPHGPANERFDGGIDGPDVPF